MTEGMAVDPPWTKLSDIAKVLSLPTEASDGGTFFQAMGAAWSDEEETLRNFSETVGLADLGRKDLQGILRRRVECWR